MTEILTESFCERCGTRYTFESAAPRRSRVGRVRMLSKGLRNFVLSDETTLSEAMADARSEEEQTATASQLDAFHKTFNFCMTCRQYTCGSCWNEAESRCLTCAPHLGHEILQAPFAEPGPRVAARSVAAAGHADAVPSAAGVEDEAPADVEAWPELDVDPVRLARAVGTQEPEPAGTYMHADARARPESDDLTPEAAHGAPSAEEDLPADAAAELAVVSAADEAPASDSPEIVTVDPDHGESGGILGLEPGQSLDDALAAYEAEHETPVEEESARVEMELEPEIVATEPEPEVVAAGPEIAPAPVREDVVAQPVWAARDPAAPDPIDPQPTTPQPTTSPIAPASGWLAVAPETPLRDAAPHADPQWPAPQGWARSPGARPEPPRTLAGRPLLTAEPSGLWAASSREVLAQAPAAALGPQPCVSCGLSLSANARFCRRCGARQG